MTATTKRQANLRRQLKWIKNNPERWSETNRTTRARQQAKRVGSLSTLRAPDWRRIKENHQYRCAYCDDHCGWRDLQMEHVIPLRHKGPNTPENIVPSCVGCNLSKRNTIDRIDVRTQLLMSDEEARTVIKTFMRRRNNIRRQKLAA
jgi:5-methylcytosine-specific restriction endonuclease McrA